MKLELDNRINPNKNFREKEKKEIENWSNHLVLRNLLINNNSNNDHFILQRQIEIITAYDKTN